MYFRPRLFFLSYVEVDCPHLPTESLVVSKNFRTPLNWWTMDTEVSFRLAFSAISVAVESAPLTIHKDLKYGLRECEHGI